MPRLSVLLPCRDAEPWLPVAIRSLERQTYRDFEVIAVDDGSQDGTRDVLEAWARRDRRVRVIASGASGLVNALRAAGGAASGELLARMDADDIAHARRFEAQVALLDDDAGLAACGTRIRYFPRATLKAGGRAYERWINACTRPDDVAREIFVECPLAHPSLVLRRSAFEAVGGYRDAGWAEDYDLVLRLWRAGHRMANVARTLLAWRDRPDRTSRLHPRYSRESFRRCKVSFLLETLVLGRPILVAGPGPTGKAFAREIVRQGGRIAGFVDVDPRRIGQSIHGVDVVAPAGIGRFGGAFAIAAVADAASRAQIRADLRAAGFVEMRDFCAVA